MGYHVASVHVAALSLSAVTTASLGVVAWRDRASPGSTAFAGLMAAVTVWTAGYLVGLTVAPGGRLLWEPMQWFGIVFVPVCFLAFALDYLGHDQSLRRTVGIASVPAVAMLALVWTNPVHGLVWREQTVYVVDGLAVVEQVFGLGYLAFFLYAYALIAVGSYLLVRLVVRSNSLYLDQSLLLLVGVVVPLVGNVVSVFVATPIPGIDVTPYAFTITGLAFGNALFRYSLFDRVPAAWQLGRETVVGSLEDPVLIVDTDRTVIYCNDAAAEVFDVDPSEAVGGHVSGVVDADALALDAPDALGEVELDGRTYEVRSSAVTDRHDRRLGYTLVFNDITERKRRERTLQRQRDELETIDRLNAVVRGINRDLIGASTRREVSETVCTGLGDSSLYDAVWTLEDGALEGVGLPADPPAGGETDGGTRLRGDFAAGQRALARHTDAASLPVPDDADGDLSGGDRPEDVADAEGFWTTVPLVYGRTVYGTLVLFTERTDAFGERELAVLDELGESAGRAVNAAEREQLLLSGAVLELEFVSTSDVLAAAAAAADATVVVEGLGASGEGLVAHCRVDSGDPAAVADALADRPAVAAVDRADDDTLLACRLTGGSVVFPLREWGAGFQSARAADGQVVVEVQVAPDADVRSVLERVQRDFPEADLRAKRRREDPTGAPPVADHVVEDLTDRQEEALRTAFRDGYFEWPRESSAEDVADSMDISSPTLHNHLRKAENRVLSSVLEDEE